MKNKCVQSGLLLTALCVLSIMPLQAQARCSLGSSAGNWAYTYTGTVFAPNPLPAAAVGHFSQDAQGNVTGSQTHTVAGQTEVEDISGTVIVNSDCTASASITVSLNGQVLRTAALNAVYDSNGNHLRMIFASLTLAGGTNVPLVVTIDANRLTTKD
jgi:hypothetical protein